MIFFNFFIIINNCLAYFVIFIIDFIYFEHFIIKRIIDNINFEFDIIEIQTIRYKNNLMLLFKSFIRKVDKFAFNYSNENINFKIL